MKTLLRSLVTFAFLATARPVPAAEVSINSLPAIGTVATSTVIPVVDVSGTPTTKKATVTQLINGLPVATGSTVGTMSAADKTKLDAATDANTASAIVRRDASGNFTAGTITATVVTGLATPTNGTDAANKSYVDASAAGLTVKQAGRAATTGTNITLSGGAPSTLDGLTLAGNDRILVKDQATGSQNGIYYVSTLGSGSNGTWTRTTDADVDPELATGTYIFISSGTVNANAAYTISTQGTITIGTTAIAWALFSQVTSVAASSITGQIIASQIQDAAINTAKFASGITPVEILGVLPSTGNFAGRQVFLTTTSKLYRYDGAAFVATTPTSDLTGTIAAGQIAANAITANEIAADAVVFGKVAAGAIRTAQIAAGEVNTANLAAGAVTASKITVANLAAINANLGTITAGSLTASSSVTVGSGIEAVSITSTGLGIGSGRIRFYGGGLNPRMAIFGLGGDYIEINGNNSAGVTAALYFNDSGSNNKVAITKGGMTLTSGTAITVQSGADINVSSGGDINIASGAFINLTSGGYINVASGGAIALGVGSDITVNSGTMNLVSSTTAIQGVGGRMDFNTGTTLEIDSGAILSVASGGAILGLGSINFDAATGNPVNITTSYSATAGTFQGYLVVKINGLTKLIPYYDPP